MYICREGYGHEEIGKCADDDDDDEFAHHLISAYSLLGCD